jgi:hypothetical protein
MMPAFRPCAAIAPAPAVIGSAGGMWVGRRGGRNGPMSFRTTRRLSGLCRWTMLGKTAGRHGYPHPRAGGEWRAAPSSCAQEDRDALIWVSVRERITWAFFPNSPRVKRKVRAPVTRDLPPIFRYPPVGDGCGARLGRARGRSARRAGSSPGARDRRGQSGPPQVDVSSRPRGARRGRAGGGRAGGPRAGR